MPRMFSLFEPSALAFALLMPHLATAQSTGSELVSDCEQVLKGMVVSDAYVKLPNSPFAYRCWGFMRAVQALSTFSNDGADSVLNTCIPTESTLSQLVRVVVRYGQQHPEKLHQDAGDFAVNALVNAFPCQRSGPSRGGAMTSRDFLDKWQRDLAEAEDALQKLQGLETAEQERAEWESRAAQARRKIAEENERRKAAGLGDLEDI